MNDVDTLIAMLSRAGVPHRVTVEDGCTNIEIEADGVSDTGPLTGYSGFTATFEFDRVGLLRCVGIWE
jgi:hypothetical protein